MITVFFDASCNPSPGPLGIGVVIIKDGEAVAWQAGHYGHSYIKEGERQASRLALRLAQSKLMTNGSMPPIDLCGDSQPIMRELRDLQRKLQKAQISDRTMDYYWALAASRIRWVERRQNKIAHDLAQMGVRMKEGNDREGDGAPPVSFL